MSDLSPLSGVERKLDFGAVRSVFDPTATFAVHCGNGFDADITPIKKSFKPIQCCLQSMGTDSRGASSLL